MKKSLAILKTLICSAAQYVKLLNKQKFFALDPMWKLVQFIMSLYYSMTFSNSSKGNKKTSCNWMDPHITWLAPKNFFGHVWAWPHPPKRTWSIYNFIQNQLYTSFSFWDLKFLTASLSMAGHAWPHSCRFTSSICSFNRYVRTCKKSTI